MIWCNFNKKARRSTWFVAPAPNRNDVELASKWCREHPSRGLFYNHYTNTRWWFEKQEDAVLFALRWS